MNKEQITYVDGKPHIKDKVVMLPTSIKNVEKGQLVKGVGHYLFQSREGNIGALTAYELYIISDEEIKPGDWVYRYEDNKVFQSQSYFKENNPIKDGLIIKIIATTDTSLGLPQPSPQFIEKYIEEYNKGNVITDVLVEVEEYEFEQTEWFQEAPYTYKYEEWKLKLDSQNQITIRKQKDSWTREEVIALCRSAHLHGEQGVLGLHGKTFREWIKENL